MRVAAVISPEVVVEALTRIDRDLLDFPAVPPPTADDFVLGVFVKLDQAHICLVLSDEIVDVVLSTLAAEHGFDEARLDVVLSVLEDMMGLNDGGIVSPNFSTQIPPTTSPALAMAIRAACSRDLEDPRAVAVVTSVEVPLILRNSPPRSENQHPDSTWDVLTPASFGRLVENAIRRRRTAN